MAVMQPWAGLEIDFKRHYIAAFLKVPHQVLSSAMFLGGLRDDIDCICNHQACEPNGHGGYIPEAAVSNPPEYLQSLVDKFALPSKTALLTTAANMDCAGRGHEKFAGQELLAVATAGVSGNAARAGDPASYAESESGIIFLPPGTINIMLFFNVSLSAGAMLDAALLATEAKVSVLQELSVASLYSSGLATGTGTDGLAVAAPLAQTDEQKVFTNTGKHSKLGEMIARAVRSALFSSLAWQNSLIPPMRCNVLQLLQRFGLDEASTVSVAREILKPETSKLLAENLGSISRDPAAAAAAAALAHIHDQYSWGVLPAGTYEHLLLSYAAMLAACAGGREDKQVDYRAELEAFRVKSVANWNLACAAAAALAIGFRDKWP